MSKLKITGKELRAIGYPESPVISIAMNIMQKHYKFTGKEEVMTVLKNILATPNEYMDDEVLSIIAEQLIPKEKTEGQEISLNQTGIQFSVFGQEYIEEGAMHQMYQAAKLPVSVAGALMPDAHSGYGLPIGGVLSTDNAVIPYGVGVDIGCRMCLSIFDISPQELKSKEAFFVRELEEATLFGSRALGANIANHYTRLAMSKRRLPQEAKNLAWLSLDEEEGMEYWLAMNLAGDYASACHHVIHAKIAKQLGRKPVKMVENHHNFAWKEMLDTLSCQVGTTGLSNLNVNNR